MNETLDQLWSDIVSILNQPLLTLGSKQLTLGLLLKLILLVVAILVAERFFRAMVLRRVLKRTHLDASLQYAISRFFGYCFIALGFFIALKLVGLDLSSLAVIAGAIGIGVGFGLQNVIGNFVSGLIILAERPIAIGHRVEVGGVAGQVTRINLRSTTVVTNDNITIIVPNSDFINNPVTNWSHGDPKVRLRVPFGVAYGSDVPKLKRVLLDVATHHPAVLKEPGPALFFTGFGDSSLNFELSVWTVELLHNPMRFRSDLYYEIEQALRDNHIEIPFPQRDLHIRSGELPVRMRPTGTEITKNT
ncbi:MAG TPA: mechanosensitive ion channel [Verrucomicrobiota bacterium]|nr:mechanosensitive ion channel [Verrucomicrobiota bacterium]